MKKITMSLLLFFIPILLFISLYGENNILLFVSFINTEIAAWLLIVFINKSEFISFYDVYFLFSYIFFGLGSMAYTSNMDIDIYAFQYTNYLIILSNCLVYLFSKIKIKYKISAAPKIRVPLLPMKFFLLLGTFLLTFVLVILLKKYSFMLFNIGYIGGLEIASIWGVNRYIGIFTDTSLRALNMINIIILLSEKRRSKVSILLIINIVLAILFYFNIFITYRWILAYALIMAANYFVVRHLKKEYLVFALIFIITLVAPISGNYFRRSGMSALGSEIRSQGLIENIATSDFDAFINFYSYVKEEKNYRKENSGFRQFVGSLLSFTPRSIWPSKPIGSGAAFAEYSRKINKNISFPLIAEFYQGIGFTGVLLYSFLIAFLAKVVTRNSNINIGRGMVSMTIIGNLLFILRGDMMSAISFTIGLLLPVLVIVFFVGNYSTHSAKTHGNVQGFHKMQLRGHPYYRT